MKTKLIAASAAAVTALVAFATFSSTPDVAVLQAAPLSANRPQSATLAPALRLTVAPDGNEARYRIREQLAGFDLPNDAVGITHDVRGSIALDKSGNVIPAESRIEVGLASLTSDKSRRDGYIRGRVLEASQYPNATLVVTRLNGISGKVPRSGTKRFTIDGDLTVRNVTKPTRWEAEAVFGDSVITGTATTAFTFADFSMNQPRVPVVLSVADTIKLEYQFKLVKQ